MVVTRHGGAPRCRRIAWTRALGGIVVAVGTDLVGAAAARPPARRWHRCAGASARAVDAARLLAGGRPSLPSERAARH